MKDTDLIHEAKEVLEALMDEALDRALDDECLGEGLSHSAKRKQAKKNKQHFYQCIHADDR